MITFRILAFTQNEGDPQEGSELRRDSMHDSLGGWFGRVYWVGLPGNNYQERKRERAHMCCTVLNGRPLCSVDAVPEPVF